MNTCAFQEIPLPAYAPFNEVILHYNYPSSRKKYSLFLLFLFFPFLFFCQDEKKSLEATVNFCAIRNRCTYRSQFASLIKKKKYAGGERKEKKIRIKAKQHRYRCWEGGKKQSTLKGLNGARRTHVTKVWHETTPIALPCKNNRGNRTNRFMNRVYAYETKPKQLLRCSQLYSIYIWKQVKKQYPTG